MELWVKGKHQSSDKVGRTEKRAYRDQDGHPMEDNEAMNAIRIP